MSYQGASSPGVTFLQAPFIVAGMEVAVPKGLRFLPTPAGTADGVLRKGCLQEGQGAELAAFSTVLTLRK